MYCLAALWEVMRRFCFTILADWTASSQEYAVRAFPHTLAKLCFRGMRLELDSGFPQKLFVRYEEGFCEITRFLPELSGNFKIF